MTNKTFGNWDANQTATKLVDRNVSFDFQAFLGKVGPAPSHAAAKRQSNQNLRAESKQAQDNLEDREQNSRG